jgi:hypothetical protein
LTTPHLRVRIVTGIVCLAAIGRATDAQEPTFKAGNQSVAVYATVKNADGRLVRERILQRRIGLP